MYRVLVTGGRAYGLVVLPPFEITDEELGRIQATAINERQTLYSKLNHLLALHPDLAICHGAAPGADALAETWCKFSHVPRVEYPADWGTHANSAGPIRNREMLKGFFPALVVACPGGTGTADMVAISRAAGVQVDEVHP